MFEPKPAYVAIAKQLRGKRAWLLGGGQLGNSVMLVAVQKVKRNGCAVIDSGDANLHEVLLSSWHLRPIDSPILEQLADVPNGQYYLGLVDEKKRTQLLFKAAAFTGKMLYSKNIKLPNAAPAPKKGRRRH